MSKSPVVRIPDLPAGSGDGQMLRWEASTNKWEATGDIVVADDGNVGIGTPTPDFVLDVAGSAMQLNNAAGAASIVIKGDSASTARIFFGDQDLNSSGQIVYDNGGDSMRFATASTERMRIDSAGNVGVGTNAPLSALHVVGETNGLLATFGGNAGVAPDRALRLSEFSIGGINNCAFDFNAPFTTNATLTFSTASTERVRIDASGNVGIGTSSPNYALHIEGSASANLQLTNSTTGSAASDGFVLSCDSSATRLINREANSMTFSTSNIEAMRLDASGNLLVNKTTTQVGGEKFGVSGTARISGNLYVGSNTAAGVPNAAGFFFDGGGVQYTRRESDGRVSGFYRAGTFSGDITIAGATTSYNTSSDIRLKKNIADAGDPFAKINAIQVREFDWKDNDTHQDFGFIAQELVEVAPEAVSRGETVDDTWGVDPSKLVPVLVKAIQELHAEVQSLKGV